MERNNFESLAENRTEFMKRLAMDDELAKVLLNKNDYFKNTTVTELEKAGLMWTQIYPFVKTTKTLTETKSYITMKFKYKKLKDSNFYKTAYITIYAFCHEDIARTKYGVLRSDYMLSQVDRLLNDTRNESWLGKLQLDGMDDVIMDQDGTYVGIAVTYRNTEFQ
jgi:hypothetical protein